MCMCVLSVLCALWLVALGDMHGKAAWFSVYTNLGCEWSATYILL